MKSNNINLVTKFCSQAFNNMKFLLKSRRIGCFLCGYVFIYDGTEETEPITLDGHCGVCPSCSNFSLFGDASENFTRAELFECAAYLRHLRDENRKSLPQEIHLFLTCTANMEKIRQCKTIHCLACGRIMISAPGMFYSITGEEMPDDETFVCPHCLAPLVVPAKTRFFDGLCQNTQKN